MSKLSGFSTMGQIVDRYINEANLLRRDESGDIEFLATVEGCLSLSEVEADCFRSLAVKHPVRMRENPELQKAAQMMIDGGIATKERRPMIVGRKEYEEARRVLSRELEMTEEEFEQWADKVSGEVMEQVKRAVADTRARGPRSTEEALEMGESAARHDDQEGLGEIEVVRQPELALAMWSDLDELIVAKIEEQGRVLQRFIESNIHLFPEVEVNRYENEVVAMLQVSESHYYQDGRFYHYEGMVNTGLGDHRDNCPRVVHLVEGKGLQELLRDKDFVSTITRATEEYPDHDENDVEERRISHTYGSIYGNREHPDPDNALSRSEHEERG